MFRRVFLLASFVWAFVAADLSVHAQAKPPTTPTPAAGAKAAAGPKSATAAEMTLARVASDESVFFLASNGWKKSDPKSTNKAEKLWAALA